MRRLHIGDLTETQALVLTNLGPGSCRLDGAPRMAILARDGNVLFTPPQTIANHGGPVQVQRGGSASVWIELLAPDGQAAAGAARIEFRVDGIRDPVRLSPPVEDLVGQQLVISAVAPGVVTKLPASANLAAPCRSLVLLDGNRPIGAAAGHSAGAIVIKNDGKRTCSVYGFPRLGVDDAQPHPLYPIPQRHAGPAAGIQLARGVAASAWTIDPDCSAFGGPIPVMTRARWTVSLPGVGKLDGPLTYLDSRWPTPRCIITVAALTAGVVQVGPGFSTARTR